MYPKAYIDYLIHFHCDRDYFECHEVLEEHWKEDTKQDRKPHWVALIQVAVSLYHHRRENFPGALRMMKSAISIIREQSYELEKLGLNIVELHSILQKEYTAIQNKVPYKSFNLPINDKKLLEICKSKCSNEGKTWGMSSDMSDEQLVHKHSLRDRSDVIAERKRQIALKQNRFK
ncbi:DUF309 domain-containing protein [Fredinandcohnia sp. 179-A 10B2 NHS]|uniref:DUF309 domain-containing protein n=1 Tax=Fredinandcohnia sp. 179-A 10B2 NHS TaxID=3235176 RepID=UPI0039A303E3